MPLMPAANGGRPFSRHALELWLRSPRGRRLLAMETAELAQLLPEVFGRHVLQVGSWGHETQLVDSAETLHRAVLGTVRLSGASALIRPDQLPLLSKSVDAVVLPHTLEFSPSPHQVLREVGRVLNDRGRVFILGFNPWGWWALRSRLGFKARAFMPGAQFWSVGRLADWLQLLDFELTGVRRFSVGFPWSAARSDGEPWQWSSLAQPFQEVYLLSAKKRVLPVNRIGQPLARAQVKPIIGAPVGARAQANCRNPQP
ncbi:MAG: class I SAM-dependent methyltransferase [Gammaproteobacteria bacterium]|jgi:SAM-dependent methyltransferase